MGKKNERNGSRNEKGNKRGIKERDG